MQVEEVPLFNRTKPSDFIVSRKWDDLHIHVKSGITHREGALPSFCGCCQRKFENGRKTMQIEEYLVEDQELEEMEARLETLDSRFKRQSARAQKHILKANKVIENMDNAWELWRKLANEIKAKHQEILKASI